MADEAPKNGGPFDVATIRQLVALMSRHGLSEIDLSRGEERIRLRRGPRHGFDSAPMAPPPAVETTEAAKAPTAPEPAKPARPATPIKSPTPGTFYAAPTPGAEPYVKVGSRVTPTTVVCMIEAMKIFNEIQADCTGVVTEVLVDNQQAVEYGQVLFNVDPSA